MNFAALRRRNLLLSAILVVQPTRDVVFSCGEPLSGVPVASCAELKQCATGLRRAARATNAASKAELEKWVSADGRTVARRQGLSDRLIRATDAQGSIVALTEIVDYALAACGTASSIRAAGDALGWRVGDLVVQRLRITGGVRPVEIGLAAGRDRFACLSDAVPGPGHDEAAAASHEAGHRLLTLAADILRGSGAPSWTVTALDTKRITRAVDDIALALVLAGRNGSAFRRSRAARLRDTARVLERVLEAFDGGTCRSFQPYRREQT